MVELINEITAWIQDNYILVGVVALIAGFFLVDYLFRLYKARRDKKRRESQLKVVEQHAQKQAVPQTHVAVHEPAPVTHTPVSEQIRPIFKQESPVFMAFDDEERQTVKVSEEEEIKQKIEQLSLSIRKDNLLTERDLVMDLSGLRTKLQHVKNTKTLIKQYGSELSQLYYKYDAREKQLDAMVQGLDSVIKHVEKQRPKEVEG